MEDIKKFDFKSIIDMIIEFIKSIFKFELNFDLGTPEEEPETTEKA